MRQRSRTWCCVCVCSLALVFGCQGKKPAPSTPPPSQNPPSAADPSPPKLSAADVQELTRLQTLALGHLENHEFDQSEAVLQRIRQKLPDDLFVWQNLAIGRLLAAEKLDAARNSENFAAAVTATSAAIAEFERRLPSSGIPALLRARLAQKSQQKADMLAALRDAVKRDPDFIAGWYELYQQLRVTIDRNSMADPTKTVELFAAGKELERLVPDNWFFWKDWANDLAMGKRPELLPLLQRMRTEFEPFAASIKRDSRYDLLALVDGAIAAAENSKNSSPEGAVGRLCNVIKPEALAQKDTLSLHSLEFVRVQYSTELPAAESAPIDSSVKLSFTTQSVPLPGIVWDDVCAVRSLDADIDGRTDLVVLSQRRLQVFSQRDGAWSPTFGVDLPGEASAFVAADLDDDAALPTSNVKEKVVPPADPEFIISGPGGMWVFENRLQADGSRTLMLRDKDAPWAGATDVAAVVLIDLDGDGDLDIFAGGPMPRWFNYRGNFLFGEVTERSQRLPENTHVTAVAAVDWDHDVDVDLIVSTDQGLVWFENIRLGRFRYRELEQGMSRTLKGATTLSAVEWNGDGLWDLVASGPSGTATAVSERHSAGRNPSNENWVIAIERKPASTQSIADFDNDGRLEYVAGDIAPTISSRDAATVDSTMFRDITASAICAGDVDGDGDVDLWFFGTEAIFARNETGNQHHWIELRPRGLQEKGNGPSNSQRVNHQAIGSLIELRVGNRYQAGVVEGQSIRFGLGKATKPDAIRIVWTNGVPHAILDPKIDMVLDEEMLPIGSCPYVYTWNGERFEFHTDLLWNAPLGLKFAEDVVAGWREWEYLKIDGDRLKPRGNEYVLQITEELWEITYFDEMKLIAVDHPGDVQVFTNEKVGPAEIAQPKLHTVKSPRLPIAARDSQGRDLLPDVLQRDGHYTKTYDQKIASGLTPEHYLELDFGDLQDAKQVTLFLTGWMYPTDTSINVQFSQDPFITRPRPPSLWAPDATGEWREVRPFMGFPGGKTKTIAVDVSDVLTRGDARLRIVTNMEFYWDHAFVTVDEPAVAVKEQELSLKHADLHFRGCSQAVYQPYNGPELYDYARVNAQPQWTPLSGNFTRYGDVTPLLRQRDDQLVVFGGGDEITVTFDLPRDPLPEGWVRDFVMYNVGWDKDAVLHTVHGTTVEPLPFQAMTWYGHIDGEPRPMDADYADYLRTYQTRRQSPTAFWNQLRHHRESQMSAARRDVP